MRQRKLRGSLTVLPRFDSARPLVPLVAHERRMNEMIERVLLKSGTLSHCTLYDLGEHRQEMETRRKRLLRKHRLMKVVEVVAWAMGLLWTALLLRSLIR